jgi:hypothetical protein
VHTLGHFGFKQPQQLAAVGWAIALGWRLDAVVNLDGFNEVAVGNQNVVEDAHPLYPYLSVWAHVAGPALRSDDGPDPRVELRRSRERAERRLERASTGPWLASAAVGPFLARACERAVARHGEMQAAYVVSVTRAAGRSVVVTGPEHARELDAALDTIVTSWVACSTSLAGLCERHGIRYLHVLQPTLHDRGSKPLTPEEEREGATTDAWRAACEAGYPRLRAAGATLTARGVPFHDASMLFVDETRRVYFDACHLLPDASGVLAEAIARELLSRMQ